MNYDVLRSMMRAPPPGDESIYARVACRPSIVNGRMAQSFQNPLNRSGASAVYRTVEAIERWPR
jgi:hypothetical protein